MRASMRFACAALLALPLAAGCSGKTYAVVQVAAGASTPAGLSKIELQLELDGQHDLVTLAEPDGSAISLPADVSILIRKGSGYLTVTAVAHKDGRPVDTGKNGGQVEAGHTARIFVTLGQTGGPGDDLGPPPDLAPPSDLALAPGMQRLTVATTGAGTGRVTSAPAGIDCGTSCLADFAEGTMITLTPDPQKGSGFTGWSGDCTGTSWTCTVTLSASRNVSANFGKLNYVFVTSTTYPNGNLGGIDGADELCRKRALAGGLPGAATPGVYRAWLSTSAVNAVSRLGTARGFIRVDGQPFADTRQQLLDGIIYHAPSVDESGNNLLGARVATSTNEVGQGVSVYTCKDWTDGSASQYFLVGDNAGSTGCWTSYGGTPTCDVPFRLYCFGTENETPLIFPRASGRVAFVSKGVFDTTKGISGADALCTAEAATAKLPGTYKAFINPPPPATTISRFSTSGAPWVRVDGVPIVALATDLRATFAELLAPLNQRADGTYVGNWNSLVWTGNNSNNAASLSTIMCNDWSSAGVDDNGATGNACLARITNSRGYMASFFSGEQQSCSWAANVYCLQE
jgi:hypothetical protein